MLGGVLEALLARAGLAGLVFAHLEQFGDDEADLVVVVDDEHAGLAGLEGEGGLGEALAGVDDHGLLDLHVGGEADGEGGAGARRAADADVALHHLRELL